MFLSDYLLRFAMLFQITPKLKSTAGIALVCTLMLGVAGCAKRNQDVTGTVEVSPDYRERHPIVLAETPRLLEIYATRGPAGLDLRQDQDIRAFAAEYKSSGRGAIIVSVPKGAASKASGMSLAGIRHSLSAAGISSQYVKVTSYHPTDLESASPVRLSFLKLQASVDSLCGQFKTDITGASTSSRFANQSYSNFGCAFQSAIAAQVAYPLDLVRPRQEGSTDIEKRNQAIKNIRSAKDPSTKYDATAQSISGK
jgi:pilus assembly protein CpaD